MFGLSSYAAGNDASQIARDAVFGGIASAAGGAVGEVAGIAARGAVGLVGLTCGRGLGMLGGYVIGASEAAAFCATEGFVRVGLNGGSATDAVMAAWSNAKLGAMIGGPLGAIFHQVCFTAGTLMHKASGKCAIETQFPGDRAMTLQTLATAHLPGDDPTAIDPANCRLVRLRSRRRFPSENVIDAELIRPLSWLKENRLVAGGSIRFRVPELDIDGVADVLAVEPCPPIEPGRGRVITGRFSTSECKVLQLEVAGEEKPIEPTPPHRFKSFDRGDWIPAEELRVDENLETRAGQAAVKSIAAKPGLHRVYNLEVEGEHHFFVGEIGVLVHNAYSVDEEDLEAYIEQRTAGAINWETINPELTSGQQSAIRKRLVAQGVEIPTPNPWGCLGNPISKRTGTYVANELEEQGFEIDHGSYFSYTGVVQRHGVSQGKCFCR